MLFPLDFKSKDDPLPKSVRVVMCLNFSSNKIPCNVGFSQSITMAILLDSFLFRVCIQPAKSRHQMKLSLNICFKIKSDHTHMKSQYFHLEC